MRYPPDRQVTSHDPLPGLQKRLAEEFGDVVPAETIAERRRADLADQRRRLGLLVAPHPVLRRPRRGLEDPRILLRSAPCHHVLLPTPSVGTSSDGRRLEIVTCTSRWIAPLERWDAVEVRAPMQ